MNFGGLFSGIPEMKQGRKKTQKGSSANIFFNHLFSEKEKILNQDPDHLAFWQTRAPRGCNVCEWKLCWSETSLYEIG